MANLRDRLQFTPWQLIALGVGSSVILGLASFGLWSFFNSSPQRAVQKKLIGQWQITDTTRSSGQKILLVFADNNKFYTVVDSGVRSEGTYQVIDANSKPQKISMTFTSKGMAVLQFFNLVDENRLVSLSDDSSFQKTSEQEILPEGTRSALVPQPQAEARNNASTSNRAQPEVTKSALAPQLQSEGRRNNIGTINRAQQAFYLEANRFSSNFAALSVGIPEETENYKYTIDVIDEGQLVWNIAASKQEDLKSYIGIVFTVKIGNQNATQAIACESVQATTSIPPRPSNSSRNTGEQTCPDGYVDLSKN